jgi:hypothetical protein
MFNPSSGEGSLPHGHPSHALAPTEEPDFALDVDFRDRKASRGGGRSGGGDRDGGGRSSFGGGGEAALGVLRAVGCAGAPAAAVVRLFRPRCRSHPPASRAPWLAQAPLQQAYSQQA